MTVRLSTPRARERVLAHVLSNDGCTRAEISAATGVSRSAVTMVVTGLLAEGVLAESQNGRPGSHGAGRPSALLRPVLPNSYVLGIDFDHSHIGVALADMNSEVLGTRRIAFDVDANALGAIKRAFSLVLALLLENSLTLMDVIASVASIPGPIDSVTGVVRSPTILSGWVGMAPAAEVSRIFGLDVTVFNDANLGAWGERVYGAGQNIPDFVYIKASDGVGAGIISGGELFVGARGLGGEIGHTVALSESRQCRCGNSGCIEVVASSSAVRAKLSYTHPHLRADDSLASVSDSASDRIFADAGRALGVVVADVCNLLNPTAVIVGGELGEVGGPFLVGIRESVDRFSQPAVSEGVTIMSAQRGRDAELMGAVAQAEKIARQRALSLPSWRRIVGL